MKVLWYIFFYEYSLKEKEYPLKVRELACSCHILMCLAWLIKLIF